MRFNGNSKSFYMETPKSQIALPLPAKRALRKLGLDISTARRRRQISAALLAERAFISRPTLRRVENGDPAATMASYASVLFALGMVDQLGMIFAHDAIGQSLADEHLPKRVRLPRRQPTET
jgi:hypothetical protein